MHESLLQAVVLGVVQGLTEFLPISSSAHLVLIPNFLHWEDPGLSFDVALHLGTLAAILIYYWKDLWKIVFGPDKRTLLNLIAATVPGAIAGVLLEHKAETVFRSPTLIGWVLIAMGTVLGIADWYSKGDQTIETLTLPKAFLIGLAQAFALIPGVSRSGVTITTALFMGFDRQEAAKFSFLMAAPIIAGAGILKFKSILRSPDHLALGGGFFASAIFGVLAIYLLLKIVQTRRYTPFVIYRWLLGLATVFYF